MVTTLVPFTVTVAPESGDCLSSVTVPVTFFPWAKINEAHNMHNSSRDTFWILHFLIQLNSLAKSFFKLNFKRAYK